MCENKSTPFCGIYGFTMPTLWAYQSSDTILQQAVPHFHQKILNFLGSCVSWNMWSMCRIAPKLTPKCCAIWHCDQLTLIRRHTIPQRAPCATRCMINSVRTVESQIFFIRCLQWSVAHAKQNSSLKLISVADNSRRRLGTWMKKSMQFLAVDAW